MNRPIAIAISPNTEKDDVVHALKMLITPWRYISGEYVRSIEHWFRNYFDVSHAVSFSSGRAALFAILKAYNIQKNDEVIIQSFTCVVVPEVIVELGAKPIYADITDEFTLDPFDLERKISDKTKVVIVQHTFGIPSKMEEVRSIARKYHLIVVEDVAHTIGGEYNSIKLGTLGDASFFSFGRDKAFSSVFGGIALTKNEHIGKQLRNFQRQLSYPSFFWIIQQLFHPIAFLIILPLYAFLSIGKVLLVLLQKLRLLSFPVSESEKKVQPGALYIKKFPNALAYLLKNQLRKHQAYNKTREGISNFYLNEFGQDDYLYLKITYPHPIPFLRFPILIDNPNTLIRFAKKKGILLGRWYSNIIDPIGSDLSKLHYHIGSCPKAEELAKQIVNLPTYPTMSMEEAKKVVETIQEFISSRKRTLDSSSLTV